MHVVLSEFAPYVYPKHFLPHSDRQDERCSPPESMDISSNILGAQCNSSVDTLVPT